MEKRNGSSVTVFLLLGLSEDPRMRILLFMLFFVIYLVTLSGNLLLIIVCVREPRLHTPMYFFLTNLSILDICYSSVTVPNMLVHIFMDRKIISFSGCTAQMYSHLFLGVTECVLLAVMSYDRYIAISYPLHYPVIMNSGTYIKMAAGCWLSGILVALLDTVFTMTLPFCGHNVIDSFFCEVLAVVKLACVDTYVTNTVIFSLGVFVLLIPSLVSLISYVRIIITILAIRSSEGRAKAFTTCASHLIVVTMFFGTAIFMYMKPIPKKQDTQGKIVSVFYTMTPPMLNPIIYSLRNKEVKSALQKFSRKYLFFWKL